MGNNDTIAISKILNGIKSILSREDTLFEIKPIAKENINSYDIYTNIEGEYRCKYTGGEFNISVQDKEIFVDRLWSQKYKIKKFRLEYIEQNS